MQEELTAAVRELCRDFPDAYWRELDERRGYPEAFVQALTRAGYMATLIPESTAARAWRYRSRCHPRRDPPLGRQRRRVPRADVHHGHAAAARQRSPQDAYLPKIADGGCACKRSA